MPTTVVAPTNGTRTEPRQKMSRSATAQTGAVPTTAPTRPRRTMSEDSSSQDIRVARTASSRTKSHGAVAKPKEKPSVHADVIDQMDITGLGVGMFHHDGPFDACAPSRNKTNKTHRAPMFAFGADGSPAQSHNVPVVDKRLSPLAQATIAAMAQSDGNGPYPSAGFAPPERRHNNHTTMMGGKLGQSSRKMTLTEAWGTAEPEPFEEFSAGTMGRNSARSSLEGPPEGGFEAMYRRDARAAQAAQSRRGESYVTPRRNRLPPPQPIFLPGTRTQGAETPTAEQPQYAYPGTPGSPGSEGARTPMVKRTKSLMQRIRKMRDNPNVPVGGAMAAPPETGYFTDIPYSSGGPPSAWAPGPRAQPVKEEVEPQSPQVKPPQPQRAHTHTRVSSKDQGRLRHATLPESPDEPFVFVDAQATVAASREKALPPPPGRMYEEDAGYASAPNGGGGIGRKISLYKKVKGAVVGTGARS